jgi:micrococcal nuclease
VLYPAELRGRPPLLERAFAEGQLGFAFASNLLHVECVGTRRRRCLRFCSCDRLMDSIFALPFERVLPVGLIVVLGSALFLTPGALGQRRQGSASACQLQSGGESTVLSIVGPQTLRLADGRFVRLAEILVPTAQAGQGFNPSVDAAAFLRAETVGRKVEIKFGGAQRDRYGVYVGHVFIAGEPVVWLQEALIGAGYAQAFPQADNHACAPMLTAVEAQARTGMRGHWGIAYFKVMPARDSRALLNLVQTYQIVEGKVDHSSESGGRLTLHFGLEGHHGLAAIIEPAARKLLGRQLGPEDWRGLSLRIRGWIDRKRGAQISVALPEQIEFLGPERASSPAP